MFRVTGEILRVKPNNGTARNGEAYVMDLISVLVRDESVVEVARFGSSRVPLPVRGDQVDWAVEVSARGQFLSVGLDSEWSHDSELVTN